MRKKSTKYATFHSMFGKWLSNYKLNVTRLSFIVFIHSPVFICTFSTTLQFKFDLKESKQVIVMQAKLFCYRKVNQLSGQFVFGSLKSMQNQSKQTIVLNFKLKRFVFFLHTLYRSYQMIYQAIYMIWPTVFCNKRLSVQMQINWCYHICVIRCVHGKLHMWLLLSVYQNLMVLIGHTV